MNTKFYTSQSCEKCGGVGKTLNSKEIGKYLENIRVGLKWTMMKLAGEIGIDRSYLHNLLTGKRPWTRETLKKLQEFEQELNGD